MRFECEYCGEMTAELEEAQVWEAGKYYDHFAIRCHSPECGVAEPCDNDDIQNVIVTIVNKKLPNGKLDYSGSLKEALRIIWCELYMKEVKE